jgi:hypothetical protein
MNSPNTTVRRADAQGLREIVRAELTGIVGSAIFVSSQRLSRLLPFVVERADQGKADELKE